MKTGVKCMHAYCRNSFHDSRLSHDDDYIKVFSPTYIILYWSPILQALFEVMKWSPRMTDPDANNQGFITDRMCSEGLRWRSDGIYHSL